MLNSSSHAAPTGLSKGRRCDEVEGELGRNPLDLKHIRTRCAGVQRSLLDGPGYYVTRNQKARRCCQTVVSRLVLMHSARDLGDGQ